MEKKMNPPTVVVPPTTRTREALWHHYSVETALANEIKDAPKKTRLELYRTLYDKLFAQVPDHPRLLKRNRPFL